MKPRLIISALKLLTSIGFYLMVVVAVCFLVGSVINIITKKDPPRIRITGGLTYDVQAFDIPENALHSAYAPDSSFHYWQEPGKFQLEARPDTGLGYYTVFYKMVHILLGLAILWIFMKVFKTIKLNQPFNYKLIKYLKGLAAIFIASDLINILHVFIVRQFLQHSLPSSRFGLIIEIGNGIITGLIIWIIAIIYQRGVELQTENELTV